ncbi:MAG TPA: XRE family transcriptional regulator [Phycisphaerales bacterium]|nr:XRE family transcriptional regulator [Phycisphaerales bacterium]HRQ76940.1 XRE family transcriptional regulator [Phycisphaerales bacterium]
MSADGRRECGDVFPPGEVLRRARVQAGRTLHQLAAVVGCSVSQLSQMENGLRRISEERAAALERALGVRDGRLVEAVQWSEVPAPLQPLLRERAAGSRALVRDLRSALEGNDPLGALRELVERAETDAGARSANIESPLPLARRIPLINSVAAGYPTEFTDLGYPVSIADEYVACSDLDDPDAFAARVVGDSMLPEYREGEIVVFSPALPTPSGSDCFVRLERDAESTFKRVFFEEDGRVIVLQPLNAAYAARRVDREEVAGLYAAAYVMRRVGR